jgi:hypothetical protein
MFSPLYAVLDGTGKGLDPRFLYCYGQGVDSIIPGQKLSVADHKVLVAVVVENKYKLLMETTAAFEQVTTPWMYIVDNR